jgi:adenosylcobyric acid synthase
MAGGRIADPEGVEGPPGTGSGLGWLPVATDFRGDKVLDRPAGTAVAGPGRGRPLAGYRIHHGRVTATHDAARAAAPWLVADDGEVLGWHAADRAASQVAIAGTTLHGLFESDGLRAEVLRWAAARAAKQWAPSCVDFAAARQARLDRIADAIEAHLDLDRLTALIGEAGS